MRGWVAGMAVAALGSAALISVPAVMASECSSKTGGSNDKVMYAGGGKYTCAYVADNGDNKIGAFATEFFTSSTAKGYEKRTHCSKQSGGVKITSVYTNSGGSQVGSSITFTAINKQDGSRHWTGGVLWNTPSAGQVNGSQFVNSCKGDTIQSNLFRVAKASITGPAVYTPSQQATFTVRVTAPDGGPAFAGGVALYRKGSVTQGAAAPPTTACDGTVADGKDTLLATAPVLPDGYAYPTIKGGTLAVGDYQIYAAFSGTPTGSVKVGGTTVSTPGYCLAPPQNLLTPALTNAFDLSIVAGSSAATTAVTAAPESARTSQAKSTSQRDHLRVLNRTTVTPQLPKAACPTDWAALQVGVGSPTQVLDDSDLTWTKRRAQVRVGAVPDGTTLRLQLLCRPRSASAATVDNSLYGSIRNDRLESSHGRSVVFGGWGKDTLLVAHHRTLAMGGAAGDQIVVNASKSAGNGGPGRDRLVAPAQGNVLLVGGPGRDVLIGSNGKTRMNASDGQPGDRVVCQSSSNQVIADKGDRVVGPCRILTPTN